MTKLPLIGFLILVVSASVLAQQAPPAPDPVDPPSAPAAPDQEEVQRRLEEAQKRLEEAAQQVAEYSAQIYSQHAPQMFRFNMKREGKGAMLGIHIDADGDDGKVDGVAVIGVTPNGPADQAGIESGDRIVAINGENLQWNGDTSPVQQMLDLMSEVNPKDSVTVEYDRDGKANSVVVETKAFNQHRVIAGRPFDFDFDMDAFELDRQAIEDQVFILKNEIKSFGNRFRKPWHELELMELTPKLGSYFNTEKGVLVVSTGENTELPLEEGDVILTIDGREPKDPSHTTRILGSYQEGEEVKMEIMRERRKRTVEFTVQSYNEDVSYQWIFDDGPNIDIHVLPGQSGMKLEKMRLLKEDSI